MRVECSGVGDECSGVGSGVQWCVAIIIPVSAGSLVTHWWHLCLCNVWGTSESSHFTLTQSCHVIRMLTLVLHCMSIVH